MARILIVDDEPAIRILVQRLLVLHGHQVDAAPDGEEALDQLQIRSYDLAIIDHAMPVMSGVELLGIVRSTPRFAGMKVLMFSGGGITEDVDAALAAGADAYLLKPFDAARLLAKVSFVLAGGRPAPMPASAAQRPYTP